mgnify:CR=1 FL=1
MADAFAPNAEFGVAMEQPVQGVENRAAEVAVRGVSGLFDSLARTKSAGASQSLDPLRQDFLTQLNVIEAQRAQGHSTKADLNMKRLMTNYTMAGGDFEQGFDTVIEATTGRSFDHSVRSEDQRQYEALVNSEQFRMAYVAAGYQNPEATEQERTNAAMTAVGELQSAAYITSRAQAGEQVNWDTQLQGAYQSIINSFKQGTMASLMEITNAGGKLTPEEISQSKLTWDQLKVAQLSRPSYVSDEQWQGMQSQFQNIDSMFESMTKLSSSEFAVENLKSILINAAASGDGTDLGFEEALGVLALDNDPNAYMDKTGVNQQDLLVKMQGRTEAGLHKEAEVRLSDTLTQSSNTGVVDNQSVTSLPEELSGYTDMSNSDRLDNMVANVAHMNVLDQQSINAGRGANVDLRNAMMNVGASMYSSTKFISSSMMSQVFGTPESITQKLDMLAAIDPKDAREARVMLRSGLESQIRMLNEAESSITSELHLQRDSNTGEYYIPASEETAVKLAAQYYDGEMRPEGFFISPNQQTAPIKWDQLQDMRKSLNVAERAFTALGVEDPNSDEIVTTELAPDYQSMSLDALGSATEKLGWNETDSTGKLTDYLQNNGQGINPAETAWCAAFVNSTLNESGLNGTGLLNARSFLDWGEDVSDPQEGDLVVLSRGDSTWQGHVGFFKGYDTQGNILILGGNQGDEVSIKSYSKDRLLGFRRANGEAVPVEKAQDQATELTVAMSKDKLEETFSSSPTQPQSPDISDSAVIADASGIAKARADTSVMSNNDRIAQIEDQLRDKAPSKPSKPSLRDMVDQILTPKQRRQIKAAGFDPSEVEFFENEQEAEQAMANGEVQPGTLWIDSMGNVFLLE